MKALILKDYNSFVYEDMPEPEAGAGEVLVKIEAGGICGSDVHGMDGSTGRRKPPIVMGHEAAGVIIRVGENVTKWKTGQRVTFDSTVCCGKCFYCSGGQVNLCDNRMVLGVSCDDYRRDGTFAEYVAVPERILYALPDGVTFAQAAMVEPLSIAVHAVRRASISAEDKVVVIGTGVIGLLVVQVLRGVGCGSIIAVDIDKERLELAKKLGADYIFKSDDVDITKEVLSLTEGRGADAAFEVVGISDTVKTSIEVLRKGAQVVLVGNITPNVEFALQRVVTREISIYGSCASSGEYPACLKMIAEGKVDVDALISAKAPLSEGALWFKRLYDKEPGLIKVILVP
jgi:L-iditol 2-dehydrogenase